MRKSVHARPPEAAGFTLVELVVTLVVSSILAMGVISFIGDSISGYAGSTNRNQLATSARALIDRMALELQAALPNSIRVNSVDVNGDQCLEFIPFDYASTYFNPPFNGPADTTFDVVDFNPFLTLASPAGVYATIYPLTTAELYSHPSPGPTALVDAITDTGGSDGKVTITLDASHKFKRRSPVDRVFVSAEPVSFCLDGGSVYRYRDYGYNAAQCTPATCLPGSAPSRVLLSRQIDNSAPLTAFKVTASSLRRNAIVSFRLNFSDAGDSLLLEHEVLVRNVP